MLEHLRSIEFPMKKGKTNNALSTAMANLAKQGKLGIIRRGIGNRGHIYRWQGDAQQSQEASPAADANDQAAGRRTGAAGRRPATGSSGLGETASARGEGAALGGPTLFPGYRGSTRRHSMLLPKIGCRRILEPAASRARSASPCNGPCAPGRERRANPLAIGACRVAQAPDYGNAVIGRVRSAGSGLLRSVFGSPPMPRGSSGGKNSLVSRQSSRRMSRRLRPISMRTMSLLVVHFPDTGDGVGLPRGARGRSRLQTKEQAKRHAYPPFLSQPIMTTILPAVRWIRSFR